MLKSKSKIRRIGDSYYLLIPSEIKEDSQYPLSNNDLDIEIIDDKLVIKNEKRE